MDTVKVFWKDKFVGKSVVINATDFDPEIHRNEAVGDWAKTEPPVEQTDAPPVLAIEPEPGPDPEPVRLKNRGKK